MNKYFLWLFLVAVFSIGSLFFLLWYRRNNNDDFFQMLGSDILLYCFWDKQQNIFRHSASLPDLFGVSFSGKKLIMYITTLNRDIINIINDLHENSIKEGSVYLPQQQLELNITTQKDFYFIIFKKQIVQSATLDIKEMVDFPLWVRDANNKIVYINSPAKQLFEDSLEVLERTIANKTYEKYTNERVIFLKNQIWFFFIAKKNNYEISYLLKMSQIDVLHQMENNQKILLKIINNLDFGLLVVDKAGEIKTMNNYLFNLFNVDQNDYQRPILLSEFFSLMRNSKLFPETGDYKSDKNKLISTLKKHEKKTDYIQTLDDRCFLNEITPLDGDYNLVIYQDITEKLQYQRDNKALSLINTFIRDKVEEGIIIFSKERNALYTNAKVKNYLDNLPSTLEELKSSVKEIEKDVFTCVHKKPLEDNRFFLFSTLIDGQTIVVLKQIQHQQEMHFQKILSYIQEECQEQIENFLKSGELLRDQMIDIEQKERFRILEKNIFNIGIFLKKVGDIYLTNEDARVKKENLNFTNLFSDLIKNISEIYSLKNIEINFNAIEGITIESNKKYLKRALEYLLEYMCKNYTYKKKLTVENTNKDLKIEVVFFTQKDLHKDEKFLLTHEALENCLRKINFSLQTWKTPDCFYLCITFSKNEIL